MSALPMRPPWWRRAFSAARDGITWLWFGAVDYVRQRPPRLRYTLLPLMFLSIVLFIRHPATNYIFDEQEALLANPYVNGVDGLGFFDVVHRDFWGLPPNGSIGSYRPLPNVYWRALWSLTKHPFWHHLLNLFVHGLNGSLVGTFAYAVTRRARLGWLTGLCFVSCAVLTEAVSGLVGIADVLGGLGAALALVALTGPARWMPLGVFVAVLFGLFSKESALVCVPLIPFVALITAPMLHPKRPARLLRALVAAVAATGAFILYVELRKQWFPSPLPEALSKPLPEGASWVKRAYTEFLIWFRQAPLPKDPLNNPFVDADFPHRVSGALRVYWRGLGQVVFPLRLSGDYSFPQEPVPTSLYGWQSVAGGLAMVGPLVVAPVLVMLAWFRERRAAARRLTRDALTLALEKVSASTSWGRFDSPLVAAEEHTFMRRRLIIGLLLCVLGLSGVLTEVLLVAGGGPSHVQTWPMSLGALTLGVGWLCDGWRSAPRAAAPSGPWPWRLVAPAIAAYASVWVVVSFFPHSNIPAVLPTVRAERFWYFPAMGSSVLLAMLFCWMVDRAGGWRPVARRTASWLVGLFVFFQALQAYRHSMDYYSDLAFWKATKDAVPNSAKAHLNYSVMTGARGDLKTRLAESLIAKRLAPKWPMAHIYTGDTLCRMKRAEEAWPHYQRGFDLGPNDRGLIALGLQCMYDEKILLKHEEALRKLADDHPGSWIAYLAIDTLNHHETHKGVDPAYRPRGYNEGVKDDESQDSGSTRASSSGSTRASSSGSAGASSSGSASASD